MNLEEILDFQENSKEILESFKLELFDCQPKIPIIHEFIIKYFSEKTANFGGRFLRNLMALAIVYEFVGGLF